MAEPSSEDMDRKRDRDMETAAGWITSHEMVVQLREALGLFAGAMTISPKQAWYEALDEVRRRSALEAEVACLRRLLLKHGRHQPMCGAYGRFGSCSCGWADVMRELAGGENTPLA